MMEKLEFGYYYHIYNRGNNREPVFFEEKNYRYFLDLYGKYIHPIADTFCWCLMKNHFHFLIRIKEKEEIDSSQLQYSTKKNFQVRDINPSRQFSHLFNAYTLAVNKSQNRSGSVFQKKFRRKKIETDEYLRTLIFYIHNNPVHHQICESVDSYKWTSYASVISRSPTKICRKEVIDLYGDLDNFIKFHSRNHSIDDIEF